MTMEVGSGQVAIVPTFRGFRRTVAREVDGSATQSAQGFSRTMSRAGTTSGRGFSQAFASSTRDLGSSSMSQLNANVRKFSARVSSARLKEQDAAGKVRVAETALNEARARGGAESARAVAAEERLASAQRSLAAAQDATARSSASLRSAQASLAAGATQVEASTARASTGFSRIQYSGTRAFGGIRSAVVGLGPLVAGAFAIDKIGGFFKSAISGASDLQQNVGGIEAVMKGGAKSFLGFSKSAATSVGISASEYNRLGTLLGSQLKNGGVPIDQLAQKTKSLISVGADLSAQFGGSAADAVDALSSALKGERDPIERYGVSLNQAKVDAEAAALGFKKVGGSLSTEANQAATLSLIMKQTADAHGAFGRESETLAHKQQVLNAMWQDGKASIGNALLPAITAMTGALIKGLGPALALATRGINTVVKGAGFVRDILAKGDFKGGFLGIEEDSPVVGVLFKIREMAVQVGAGVKTAFSTIGAFIRPLIPTFGQLLKSIGPLIVEFVKVYAQISPLGLLIKALIPVLPQLGAAFSGLLKTVIPVVTQIATMLGQTLMQLVPILVPIVGQLAGVFTKVFQAILPIVPLLGQLIGAVLPVAAQLISALVPVILPLVQVLLNTLIPVIQNLLPVVTTVFKAIVPIIKAAMQIILGVVKVVTGLISGNWSQVWAGLKGIFSGLFDLVIAVVKGAFNILKAAVTAAIKNIVTIFTNLGPAILKALAGFGGLLLDIGTNLVEGLKRGISDGWNGLLSTVSGLVEKLPAVVKKILGIHSPSRVMAALGRFVGQGFAQGIEGTQKQVAAAMQSLANKVVDAMTDSDVKKRLSKAIGQPILDAIGTQSGKLQSLATQRDSVAKKLKSASASLVTVLKEQSDYAKQIASAAISRADVTSSVTSTDMIQNLKDQVTQTKQFQAVLLRLRKLGLDKTTYQQFLSKGVDGLASAQGLLAGGRGAVKTVNGLQKQLGAAANSLGTSAAKSLYGAGVNAAKGVVEGLKSQRSAIAKTMASISSSMVAAIKKALGIHSPSTVFRDKVGKFIPAGVIAGIDAGQPAVDKRLRNLAMLPAGLGRTTTASGALVASVAATQAVTAPTSSKADRPIYMDGTLFGVIRELANGEATLVVNQANARSAMALSTGLQRGK